MFRDQKRFGHDPTEIRRSKTTFRDPLKWKEPRMIFVCSWSDFFHEDVPAEWRRDAWEIMGHAKEHTFLLLTKRPENMIDMLPTGRVEGMWKYARHIWLGVSTENQAMANLRIPKLLEIPAQVHFVSAEPLLGPISFRRWLHPKRLINWIITGGESDLTSPRTINMEWVINIRNQCRDVGVAYFHKQHGGTRKVDGAWGGREFDGRLWNEIPERIVA
jgi:protein gp37